MFFEPAPTAFDLRFRLFGIPIRVHPLFWIIGAVFGWGHGPGHDSYFLPGLLIWIAVSFVSILIHEMGHVLMGRIFGSEGHIVLYSFGGLAIGSNALRRRWQRILVSFAGPGAQFVLLAVVIFVVVAALSLAGTKQITDFHVIKGVFDGSTLVEFWHPLVRKLVRNLYFVNLYWSVLNLLPIWPLDGGRISREVGTGISPDHGAKTALGISMLLSALLAANALAERFLEHEEPLIPVIGHWLPTGTYVIILFGMLALGSFRAMQQLEAEKRWQEDKWDW